MARRKESKGSGTVLGRWARSQASATVLTVVAVLLIPWTAWLGISLPSRHVSPHWDVAWVGFDVALTLAIAGTGIALWRRSRLVPFLSTAAGTLLVVDAWFDLVTSRPGGELDWAITVTLVAELPIAVLCFWMVWRWTTRGAVSSV